MIFTSDFQFHLPFFVYSTVWLKVLEEVLDRNPFLFAEQDLCQRNRLPLFYCPILVLQRIREDYGGRPLLENNRDSVDTVIWTWIQSLRDDRIVKSSRI